jgi:acyl-coenzyme A synthetase/AMP-(fatty) acid ligase
VADAGVVGVSDPVMGQKTKAFVVLKAGTTPSDDLKKELIEHCKGKIAVYKLPRDIEFIDAMPRTAVGKLLRRMLRQREIEKTK